MAGNECFRRAENAIPETLHFKIFPWGMPLDNPSSSPPASALVTEHPRHAYGTEYAYAYGTE